MYPQDDKNAQKAREELREGDLIKARHQLVEDLVDYRFIKYSAEAPTCLGERLTDGRRVWLTLKQITVTGERAPEIISGDETDRKKVKWTLGDPVPPELIKKRTRSKG